MYKHITAYDLSTYISIFSKFYIMNTITSAICKLFFKKYSLWQKPKKWLVRIKFMAFFKKTFLNVNHFFTVFIEFVTILCLFYVVVFWSQGMWDLSYLTRNQTHIPCTELNHWTTRDIPNSWLFINKNYIQIIR